MDDHETFTKLNDAILLHFNSFNSWEQTYLTDLQYKMVHHHLVSDQQKALAMKIVDKKVR